MICVHYNDGRVLHGMVLAFGDRLMRVAVRGSDDAVEFRLVGQVWVSEDCEVVKLEMAERIALVNCEQADLLEALIGFEMQPVSIQRVM